MRQVALLLVLLAVAVVLAAGAAPAKDEKNSRTDEAPGAPTTRERGPRPTAPPGEAGGLQSPGHEGSSRQPMRVAPMFRDVTEEDIADILAFVTENMPWTRVELERLRETEPEHFRQVCRHMRFEIAQLRQLKERDPEAFRKAIEEKQLKSRAQDLANKARAATDPTERDAFVAELRKVVDRLLDVELANRAALVRQLEQRLEALKQELKDRAAAREQVLKSRLDDLLKGKKEQEFKFGGDSHPSGKHEKSDKDRPEKPDKK